MTNSEIVKKISKQSGISEIDSKIFFNLLITRLFSQYKPGDILKLKENGFFHLKNIRTSEDGRQLKGIIYSDSREINKNNNIFFLSDFEAISFPDDHNFSLSLKKAEIPLGDEIDNELFIPPTGTELISFIDAKAESLINESEILRHDNKEDEVFVINTKMTGIEVIENVEDVSEFKTISEEEKIVDPDKFQKVNSISSDTDISSFSKIQDKEKPGIKVKSEDEEKSEVIDESVYTQVRYKRIKFLSGNKKKEQEEKKEEVVEEPQKKDFEENQPEEELLEEKEIEEKEPEEIFIEDSVKQDNDKYLEETIDEETEEQLIKEELEEEKIREQKDEEDSDYNKPDQEEEEEAEETIPVLDEDITDEEDESKSEEIKEKSASEFKKKKRSGKKVLIPVFLVIIIIIAAGVFFYDDIINLNGESKNISAGIPPSDPVIIERDNTVPVTSPYSAEGNDNLLFSGFDPSLIPGEKAEVEKQEEVPVSETLTQTERTAVPIGKYVEVGDYIYTDGKIYFIQVSSWKSKSKAEEHMNQLKEKGYSASIGEVLFPNGNIYYRVKIGDFESLREAQEFLQKN